MEFYDFPYIGNFIIPTDEVIFFRGLGQPPTNQPTRFGIMLGDFILPMYQPPEMVNQFPVFLG